MRHLRSRLLLDALENRTVPATFTVTNAADSGAGSLRQAVLDANANSGADLVDFSSFFNVPRTITLASSMSITGPVTIDGPSAANVTISGNNAVRIFDTTAAPANTSIALVDLTLTAGLAPPGANGGAILAGNEALSATRCAFTSCVSSLGGAIYVDAGPLTVTSCAFVSNKTNYLNGGAIYDFGTLTATDCVFQSNSTGWNGCGGAISAGPTLTATDCVFNSNSALNGGGAIFFNGTNGAATLKRCGISDNTGVSGGGGLCILGPLLLEASTVSGNQVSGTWGAYGYYPSYGGGIYANGSATIRNCTISGNSSGIGGGIRGNTLNVQNSTITNNAASDVNGGGGIWATQVTLESSIVSLNSAYTAQFAPDIFAFTVNAKTSSIYHHADVLTFNDLGGNRPVGEDPQLGPLQNNGGPTKTHALLPGSPCINVGSNPANLTTDQRGSAFARVFNGKADIGAYEVQPATHVQTVQVNNGSVQRSVVKSLLLTFDQTVTLPPIPSSAFLLKRQSDNAVVNLNALVSGNTVTLTFTGGAVDGSSLSDGRYTLTVLASQINGGNFDGDGNGTPGDDYVLVGNPAQAPKLFRLFGDADGNGTVDGVDFGAFRLAFNTHSTTFDFDGNGVVDGTDFGQFRMRFGVVM